MRYTELLPEGFWWFSSSPVGTVQRDDWGLPGFFVSPRVFRQSSLHFSLKAVGTETLHFYWPLGEIVTAPKRHRR